MFPHRNASPIRTRLIGIALGLFGILVPIADAARANAAPQIECSGANACRLSLSNTDAATGPAAYRLTISPSGQSKAAWALAFEAPRPRPDDARAMQWEFDGQPGYVVRPEAFALFGDQTKFHITDASMGDTLLAKLRASNHLRISYLDALGTAYEVHFALVGISAALDALAQDVGLPLSVTTTAAPARLAPITPPSRAEAVRALGVPYEVVDRHIRSSICEDIAGSGLANAPILIDVLSQVATLYALPCTSGAGRTTHRLYIRDSGEIGGVETLYFALHDPRFGWVGTDLLTNPTFDTASGRLQAEWIGRSDRICGYRAAWEWREYAFKLVELVGPTDCRDSARPDRWTSQQR